jgi:glycosyltransferase involved in cell wall biosynthesis
MLILLSICIPTYNREILLEQLFQSLLFSGVNEYNVEIIVSDNASIDNTKILLEKWAKVFKFFKYSVNQTNLGFDINLNNAVKLSTGKYVWLFGDDDQVTPDSIRLIIDKLINKNNNDIFILSGYLCDSNLKIIRKRQILKENSPSNFILNSTFDLVNYIDCVKDDLSFVFAFIGSLLIKKSLFVLPSNSILNSGYDHVQTILFAIVSKVKIFVSEENYYYARVSQNTVNNYPGSHLLFDMQMYKNFINLIYSKDPFVFRIKKSIGNLFSRQYKLRDLLIFFYNYRLNGKKKEVEDLLNYYYFSKTYINILRFLSIPILFLFLKKLNLLIKIIFIRNYSTK